MPDHPDPKQQEARYQLDQLWWIIKAIAVASILIAIWQQLT